MGKRHTGEWFGDDYDVPDLTANSGEFDPTCAARTGNKTWVMFCTRREGHTGRHAAGTGSFVVGVWN